MTVTAINWYTPTASCKNWFWKSWDGINQESR